MLLNGDGEAYEGLGSFKSVLSKAGKIATTPHRLAFKHVVKPAAGMALGIVAKPFAAGQPVAEVGPAPCGFFQKLARAFGGSPNCS